MPQVDNKNGQIDKRKALLPDRVLAAFMASLRAAQSLVDDPPTLLRRGEAQMWRMAPRSREK
jgi:hypothetical protein